jgi:tetratricopeptide (TPR) repeat protein
MMIPEAICRLVLLIALAAAQMSSRDSSLSAALAELDKGHILESIQQLKQIVRTSPADGSAYFYLSTLYTRMGEYAAAERYIQRAIEINPQQGEYYHQLGLIRDRQKQWGAALGLFKQALEIGSGKNEAPVWKSIGDVELELFDRDAALQSYTQALRIQPNDAQTRLALGRFYLERGEPDRAIEHLLAALESDPLLLAAYPLLGRANRQSGNLSAAESILRETLNTSPADQESRYALGQTLLAMGRADEAGEELGRYERIRQQVASANINYETALARLADGKFAEAEKSLLEAVRLAPTYGPALHSLGSLLLDRGAPEKALAFLHRAVEVNPLNAASWYGIGAAYFKTGKTAQAFEAAKRAVALNEDDRRYQRLLAEIQGRLKR